jgi:Ni/Co efflux regulator RcnB
MKKVLVYVLAVIFVAGTTAININAQEKKESAKKEMVKDTTKKAKAEKKEWKKNGGTKKGTKGKIHHNAPVKKGEAKKDTTKKK